MHIGDSCIQYIPKLAQRSLSLAYNIVGLYSLTLTLPKFGASSPVSSAIQNSE